MEEEAKDARADRRQVDRLVDKVSALELAQAKLEGRMGSAEGSIDRLTASSATAHQVFALSELVTLKLNHLLEQQLGMQGQIKRSTFLVFICVLCGIGALLYVAFTR